METVCPVCGREVVEGSEHCSQCGFPASLRAALDGPVTLPEPPPPDGSAESLAAIGRPRTRAEAGPEAEVNASIARGLIERTELLYTLDPDAPDVTGELCEAALNEAAGRAADAQQILRSAQGRLGRETEELLGRHLTDLEARGKALEAAGLRLSWDDELGRLAEGIVAGEPSASVAALLASERRVARLEADWQGVQSLLAQVMTLRKEAVELGLDAELADATLEAAQSALRSSPATEQELARVAQAASQSLLRLNQIIPPALESELARHREAIDRRKRPHPKSSSVRRLHSEASRHLSEGHLESAVESVRALRELLAEIAREPEEVVAEPPAPPPVVARVSPPPAIPPPQPPRPTSFLPPEPSPAPSERPSVEPTVSATPTSADAVQGILQKARTLAARVRGLPPDSAEAADAARQIHEATDLLRARRFAEADAALTRLMRTLPPPPGRP